MISDNHKVRTTVSVQFKIFYELKEKGFAKRNEMGKHVPTARSNLTPWAHADILEFYNQKVRVTLNYYSFASNRSSLNQIVHVLHMSNVSRFSPLRTHLQHMYMS